MTGRKRMVLISVALMMVAVWMVLIVIPMSSVMLFGLRQAMVWGLRHVLRTPYLVEDIAVPKKLSVR